MTHDRYCAYEWHLYEHDDPTYNCDESCDSIKCTCEYVAMVRADERQKTIVDCIEVVKGAGSRAADNGLSRVGPLEIIAAMRTLQRKP